MYVPPPTRRGWGLKIVAGAVIAVLSSVTTSAVAVALLRKHSQERAPTPATATLQAAEPDLESRGRAEEVPLPSTIDASAAARPAWASGSWAPQSSRALALFNEATPITEPALDRAFVICRFGSFGNADAFAGDDLQVRAVFGSAPELFVNGPEDANLAFVSAPIVTLNHGDGLRFEVYDRDVFSDTLLSRTHPKFTGPIAGSDQGSNYECRTLVPDAHARIVKTYAAVADGALAVVGKSQLDANDVRWGYPSGALAHSEAAIGDVAALTGWADARTSRRVQKLAAQRERIDAETATLFGRLHGAAGDHASFDGLDVKVQSVDCSQKACRTELSVHNRSDKERSLSNMFSASVYVATAAGPTTASFPFTKIAPGATTTLDVESHGPDLTQPSVLGLCDGHQCTVLAVQ